MDGSLPLSSALLVSMTTRRLLKCFLLAAILRVTAGFEVFTDQQLLYLNDPTRVIDFNNTEYGSTHVDDYWAKIDINYSPLEGWNLFKHVRIGCFLVQWTNPVAYAENTPDAYEDGLLDDERCVSFCNRSQAYLLMDKSLCRCGLDETLLPMVEARGECPAEGWEVFREYDFRSSMSPSTYDVSRRLLYQIVTLRIPFVDDPIRHYIHAVNALESRPKFDYDTRLDRMVFNAVWDFGKSRLVALSLSDWGGTLDLSIVTFNSSSGELVVRQNHFPIEDQIGGEGQILSTGMASCDGLGTLDILYGTYFTVVPAVLAASPQVVHTIVAIDIEARRVINSATLPVTLMNLQMNCLTHVLYGAGADLTDRIAYYQLCQADNVTVTAGGNTQVEIQVACELTELGALPSEVNQMYIQSAAIDHQWNYAWFTYKEEATGRPLIMEYHQDSKDYVFWPQDSLPENALYSSMINTAPRIIFALYPPTIRFARFNIAGTKLFISFDASTLRGAIPIDSDGDEIPDLFNEEDKAVRGPCEDFLDAFTMKLMPGTMCQWTTDADFFVEIEPTSTIAPGDLARIKPGTIYTAKQTPSGVYQFSQPSSDFAIVEVPLNIPYPTVEIGGLAFIDTCTELLLDGSQSTDHGFRGTFLWQLNGTDPEKPEPHIRQLQKTLEEVQAATPGYPIVTPQVIRVPAFIMQGDTTYNFSLSVASFWNPAFVTTEIYSVKVSVLPVPPMTIFGSYSRQVEVQNSFSLTTEIFLEGCAQNLAGAALSYKWIGCKRSEAVMGEKGQLACTSWGTGIRYGKLSGIASRSMFIEPFALDALETYIFTAFGEVNVTNGGLVTSMRNQVSAEVEMVLGELAVRFHGGSFSTPSDVPIVIDFNDSLDVSDPEDLLGASMTYTYSCNKFGTTESCFPEPQAAPAPPDFGGGIGGGFGGGVSAFRRLSQDTMMERRDCTQVTNPNNGAPLTFDFRGEDYNEALGISYPPLSDSEMYCNVKPTAIIIKTGILEPGVYTITVNATKTLGGEGVQRTTSASLELTVLPPIADSGRFPLVNIFLESNDPITVGSSLRMRGEVANKQPDTEYLYVWSAWRYGINPDYSADAASMSTDYAVPRFAWVEMTEIDFNFSDPLQVRTPSTSNFLVVAPSVLAPGQIYKMRLEALDSAMASQGIQESTGFAEMRFVTKGLPPSGGELIADNITGVALETDFVFTMDGWGCEDIPLSFRFSYVQDYSTPFEALTQLNIMYTERNYIRTRLPQGFTGTQNMLRVVGSVRSSLGATAHAKIDVSVRPPTAEQITAIQLQALKVDPETALMYTTMLAKTPAASEQDILSAMEVVRGQFLVGGNGTAITPEVVATVSDLLTAVVDKGIRSEQVINDLDVLVNLSIDRNFLSADGALGATDIVDVTGSLLYSVDAITPGEVPTYEDASARRLKGGRGNGGLVQSDWPPRRLQSVVETRDRETMYSQYESVISMEKRLAAVLFDQMYPQEVPLSFALPGQDIFFGKDYSTNTEELRNHAAVRSQFELPSLERPNITDIFNYRYVQYKKFPYDFMTLPANRSLSAPASANESRPEVGSLVPAQNYSDDLRLWQAITLEITDEAGDATVMERSLENVTYAMLPKILAYDSTNVGNVEFPSTCFWVDLGDGNLSNAVFDPRGSIFSEDACISLHTVNWVIFADDLASQLDVIEEEPGALISEIDDEFITGANVVGLTLEILAVGLLVAASIYLDLNDEANNVTPQDTLKTQVVDRSDPREKILGTLLQSLRRNHLIIGWNSFHLKLTRVRRAFIFVVALVSLQAVSVLQHSILNFKANANYLATGLVAAVLTFPLVQFLEFCFEWLPQSRILHMPPPRSMPATPIPLKEQAHPKTHKYPRRPLVGKIRPPLPKAPPRAPTSLQLPVMPTLKLTGPAMPKGRPKPPLRPPGQVPKPPQEPPPPGHLLARTPKGGMIPKLPPPTSLGLGGIPDMQLMLPRKAAGPWGLTLPELPPLPQGTLKAIEGGKPLPAPPPKGAGGPRPPKAPPPMTKMFFVAPKGVQMPVPPVPALPSGAPTRGIGPSLPKLPPMRLQTAQLSATKLGGDSARLIAPPPLPPPVPPPKAVSSGAGPAEPVPVAPATPREDELVKMADDELMLTGMQPEFAEVPEKDVEVQPPGMVHLADNPEHTMAPADQPVSPSMFGGPRPPAHPPRGAQANPALPKLPSMALAKNPGGLAMPKGMQVPPVPNALALPGQSMPPPMAPPPIGSEANLELASLRLNPGGELRMAEVPKLAPLELPSAVLQNVPQVQKHPKGIAPPPPPAVPPPHAPKMPGQSSSSSALVPLPPQEGQPLIAVRKLAKIAPGQITRRPPRPPPKLPGRALVPTPPVGPPPAHAIVLKPGNPVSHPHVDLQAVVTKAKPPSGIVRPPVEPLPNFVYRAPVQGALGAIVQSRHDGPKASALDPLPPKAPPMNEPKAFSALPPVVQEFVPPEKGPKPVPEVIVKASIWMVYFFVAWIFAHSVALIAWYGTYMPARHITATYIATACGALVNFGVFECVKCVVLGCVELVKHETVKRQMSDEARKARIALKNQRQLARQALVDRVKLPPPLLG
eukprot:TRINITY_DN36303_c0_g1_i1.p1 TRINITY_DN36303_c0_g1~~TRINITY_DN36303_c0_g1_i1.p1  ORF type:complete len:2581 (+),score=473.60 TRINITY_DN36303_c0_g1_i1:114-7856(+)